MSRYSCCFDFFSFSGTYAISRASSPRSTISTRADLSPALEYFRAVLAQLKTVPTGAALADIGAGREETASAEPAREIVIHEQLGADEFPDIQQPIVGVTIVYPGASPETVEREIVDPIEEAFSKVKALLRREIGHADLGQG